MAISTVQVNEKPWGHEEVFADNGQYIGRVLRMKAGHRFSLHYHRQRYETLMVQSGLVRMQVGKAISELAPGQIVSVEPNVLHRMSAIRDSAVIEVSSAGMADIVRVADDYGRADK